MKTWGTSRKTSYDGVLKQEFATQAHEPGQVVVNTTQPDKNIILEQNKQIRDNKLQKDLGFGRRVACIPLEDLMVLRKKFPDLNAKDGRTRAAAWARVLKDPSNKKYLTVDKY
jgi:hypothetical protein